MTSQLSSIGGAFPPGWLPITLDDEKLYSDFFERTEDSLSYENNWCFVCQEARYGGIKYIHDHLLLTGIVRHVASPFLFVFPPLGSIDLYTESISGIAESLSAHTGKRIVLRKLTSQCADRVLSSGPFRHLSPEVFVHPRDIPEDIYPQVIVDVSTTRRLLSGAFMKVRNHIAHFSLNRPNARTLTPEGVVDVVSLIGVWNELYYSRHARHLSAPDKITVDNSAYSVFAERFAKSIDSQKYFCRLIYVGDAPVGFSFAGRISPKAAALYSSISLTSYRGASEYLLMDMLDMLASAGIEFLNMGGSETRGLFEFKSKFATSELRQCYDIEYYPR